MGEQGSYLSVYTPDPEALASVPLPKGPPTASLGAVTAYDRQELRHLIIRHDLVNSADDHPDPREALSAGYFLYSTHPQLANAAAGYISHEDLDRHPDLTATVDAYYQPHFTDEFYDRHQMPRSASLSTMLRQALTRGADDEFVMSKPAYVDLLADLAVIHGKMAAEFKGDLPGYIAEHTKRLQTGGLGRLVPRFQDRVQTTHIELDDGFTTLLHRGAGFHSQSPYRTRLIRVAPTVDREGILRHEFGHMIEGNGLAETFPDAQYVELALREALAEQLQLYLSYGGNIQAISPDLAERRDEDSSYDAYRRMLDLLCNGGLRQISIHDFIDTNVAENEGSNTALLTAIAQNFPDHPNLIGTLDPLIKEVQVNEEAQDVAAEAQRAQAAEANLVLFVDTVRQHYAPKPSPAARIRRLLQKPWSRV